MNLFNPMENEWMGRMANEAQAALERERLAKEEEKKRRQADAFIRQMIGQRDAEGGAPQGLYSRFPGISETMGAKQAQPAPLPERTAAVPQKEAELRAAQPFEGPAYESLPRTEPEQFQIAGEPMSFFDKIQFSPPVEPIDAAKAVLRGVLAVSSPVAQGIEEQLTNLRHWMMSQGSVNPEAARQQLEPFAEQERAERQAAHMKMFEGIPPTNYPVGDPRKTMEAVDEGAGAFVAGMGQTALGFKGLEALPVIGGLGAGAQAGGLSGRAAWALGDFLKWRALGAVRNIALNPEGDYKGGFEQWNRPQQWGLDALSGVDYPTMTALAKPAVSLPASGAALFGAYQALGMEPADALQQALQTTFMGARQHPGTRQLLGSMFAGGTVPKWGPTEERRGRDFQALRKSGATDKATDLDRAAKRFPLFRAAADEVRAKERGKKTKQPTVEHADTGKAKMFETTQASGQKPQEQMTFEDAISIKRDIDERHGKLVKEEMDDIEFFGKDSNEAKASSERLRNFEIENASWTGAGRRDAAEKGNISILGKEPPPGYVREGDRYVYRGDEPMFQRGKEPWEMTYQELRNTLSAGTKEELEIARPLYERLYKKEANIPGDPWNLKRAIERGDELPRVPMVDLSLKHKADITRAIADGKPVPPEVLADYPDLAQGAPRYEEPAFKRTGSNSNEWDNINWNKVNTYLKRKGYDVRGADDVQEIYRRITNNFTKPPTGDHLDAIEYSKPKEQTIETKAARHFGLTNSFEMTGYITPEGKMLDFSGRKQGNTYATERGLDHREINLIIPENDPEYNAIQSKMEYSNSAGMLWFMNRGNIRTQLDGIDIVAEPTNKQYSIIRNHIAKNANGGYYVDITDPNTGNTVMSFQYNFPDVKPSKVINDIAGYFKKQALETGGDPRFTMGEQRPAPRTLQEAKEIAGSLFKSNAKEGHRALNALIDAGVGWDVALEKVVDLGGQYLMDPKAITDATQRRIIGEWLDPHTAKTPHVTAPEQKLITEADILNRLDFDEHADTIKEVYKNEGDRAANFLVDLLNADIETVDTHVGSGKIIVQVGDVSADNADRLIKAGAEFVQVENAPNLKYIVIPESATVPKLASQFQDDPGYERPPAETANPKVISRDAFQSLISSPSPKMGQRPAPPGWDKLEGGMQGSANADELRASLEPIVEQKFPRLKGRMTVVQRDADLDPDVRAALRKAGMPRDGYRAFAYKGRVYFVGDNIQSHKAAQEATLEGYLRHEGRHVAIREMFGGDTHGHDAFMTQAAKLYDSEVRDFMNKWNIEDTPRSRIKAAEEVLVEQIKRGKTGRLIDAFIARFRGWARKVFPGLELSKAEARAMIARADRILEDDAPVILGGARQPAFQRTEDQPGADANSLIKQAQAAVDKGKTMAEKQRALDEWKAQNPEAAREVEGEGRVYRAVGQAEMDTIVRTGQVKSALTMALPIERALGLTAVGDSVRDVGMYADINRQGGGKALILEMTPSEDMRTDWASLPKMLSERAELRQETANLQETMRRKGPEWENAERFRDWIASNEKRLEELDKTMGNTDFSGVNVDSLPRGVNLPYRQTPKAIAADRITAVYEQDAQGALKDVTQDVLGRPSRPSPLTLRPDGTLAGMEQRPAASSPAQPEFQRMEAEHVEPIGEGNGRRLPVKFVEEKIANPRVTIGKRGNIEIATYLFSRTDKNAMDPIVRNALQDALDKEFGVPEEPGVFYRYTNNSKELDLATHGKLKPSRNQSDNVPEKGVSVSSNPAYGLFGYKYAYKLTGNIIGYGSDGEPLLDPSSIKPLQKGISSSKTMSLKYSNEREKAIIKGLKRLDWTRDQYESARNNLTSVLVKEEESPSFQRKEAAPDESMGFFDRLGAAAAKGTGLSMGLPTIPEGEAPKGGKPRPKILDLFTKTPVLDTEGKPTDTTLRRFPIEQMKVSEIAYRLPSGEAPIEQFKKFNLRPGDNEEAQRRGFTDYEDALKQYQEHGVLYSLGEFSEFPARPITVFEYKDGKRIVGTGRHRRYSALRTEGTDKVPVQVFKEADGWTLADMKALDAITNIQDEKGDVQDFFEFFSNTRVSEAEAKKMGLLASPDGRRAWTLAEVLGGDEGDKSYLAQHMPGKPLGIDDWKQAGDIVMTAEKVYQERVKAGKEADRDWLHMALHALYKDNPRVPYRDALMFARNAGTRVEAGFLDVKGEQQDLFEVDAMRDWKTLQIERNKRVMQRRNTLDATRQGLITKLQIIKKISPDSIPSDYTVPTEGGQTSVRNAQLEDAVKEEIKDPGYVKNIIEQIEAAKIERQRLENYEQHKDIVDRIDAEIKADIDVNKSKFAAQEAERKAAFEQIQEEMKRRKEHKKLSDEPKPEPDATGDMFGEGEKPAAEKPAEPAAPKAMPRNLVRVPFGPDIEDKGFTRAEHREAVRAALLDFREQKNPSDPETILSMDDFGGTTVSPNKVKVHGMSKAAYKQIHESEYGPIEHIAPELFHDQPWRLQYTDRALIGDKATEDEHIAQVVEALWRGVPDPDNPGKRQFLSVEDYNRVFNSEWNEPDMGNAPFAARAYGDPLEFLKAHGRDMRTAPPSNKTDGRKNLSDVIHGLNSAALDQRSFTRFWSANGKALGETPPQEVIDGVRAKAEALKTLSGKLSRASKGAGLLREQNAIAADKHYFDKAIADGLISEDIARKVQAVLADTVIRNSAALNRAYGMYGPSGDPGDQTAKALKILGDIQPVAGVDFDTVVAPGEAKGYYGDLLASAQKQAGDDTKWQYSEWKKAAVDFESVTANVARKTGLKQIYTSGVMLTKSRLLYDQWKSATDRKWMELTAGMKFDRMTPDEKQACIDAFTTGDLQKAPEAVRPVVQFLMDLEKSEIHKLKFNRMFSYIYDYTDDAMGRAKMESHFNEDVLAWLDGTGLRELYKEDPISAIAEALRLSVSPESDALKITNYYPAKHESTSLASDIDWELQGGPDYGKAIEGVSHEKSRMAKTPRQMAGDENPLNKMMSHYRTVNARFYMRAAANTFWSMVEPNIETTSRRASLEGMREKINAIAAPRTPLTDMEKIARHIGSMAYVPRALGSAFKNIVGSQHNMFREQFPTEGIFLIRSAEDFQKRLAELGIERSKEDIIREYTQSASIEELLTSFQIEREMDTHEMSATARALARFGKPGYGPGLDLARNAALAVLDAAEYALARGRGDSDVQDIRVTQALDDMLDHPLVSPANYLYHKLGTKMGAMMGAADTFNRTNDGFGYIRGFKRMHDRLSAEGRDPIEIFNEMYAKGIFVKMNDAQRLYIADLMRTGDIGEAAWEYGRINTTVDNGEYRPYLASLWGGKQGLRTLTPYLTYARLNTYKVARLLDSTARDFTKWAKTGDVDAGRAFAHDMKGMSIYVAMGAIASAFTVGVTGKWGKPGVFSSDDPDEDGIVRKMLNASTEYQMNSNATLLSWGLNAYRNMRKYGRTTSHAGEVMFDYIAGVKQAQDVILLGLDKAGMQTMSQEEYERAWERIVKSQRRFSYDWMAGYAQLERTWGNLIGDPDFNAYKFAAAKLGADIEPYSDKYPHRSKNPFVYPIGALTGWGEYIEKPKKPQYGPRKRYSRNSNAAMPSMGGQMPTMPGQ